MAEASWLEQIRNSEKTCLLQDGKKKVHYVFPGKKEMVEEYHISSNQLLSRKWKTKTSIGTESSWNIEIGEPSLLELRKKVDVEGLAENASNPLLVRLDTPTSFLWKIRNLPYPESVFCVDVEDNLQFIVVRTTNKKYYKKINIPDLDRLQIPLDNNRLSFSHSNNTLQIQYEKPTLVMNLEKEISQELKKIKPVKEDDLDCKQS